MCIISYIYIYYFKYKLSSVLLYGNDAFDNKINRKILVSTVPFIKDPHKFDKSFLLC